VVVGGGGEAGCCSRQAEEPVSIGCTASASACATHPCLARTPSLASTVATQSPYPTTQPASQPPTNVHCKCLGPFKQAVYVVLRAVAAPQHSKPSTLADPNQSHTQPKQTGSTLWPSPSHHTHSLEGLAQHADWLAPSKDTPTSRPTHDRAFHVAACGCRPTLQCVPRLTCMNSSTPRCKRMPSHTPSPSRKPLSRTETLASGRHTRSKPPGRRG
jgi:hypothetical protein